MVWDNECFENLEPVIAIEIKALAGQFVAFYRIAGNELPNTGRDRGTGLILERNPGDDIRTFIVWARGVAQAMGLPFVSGLS